jgi:hypothetical protein
MGRIMKSRFLGICAVVLAAVACLGGVASAKAKTSHAKANIQNGNGDCGKNHPELPVIGTVTFKRVGNIVTLNVVMKHAEPNKTFGVFLYGPACGQLGMPLSVTTNKKGSGKGSGSIEVPAADTEFFADPYDHVVGNDTPYVKLP